MPSTVAHNVGGMDMAIMEAEVEAKGDVVDVEILRIPPPLMALMYQTRTALLPHRNGTRLILDILLYFSYMKTIKNVDLEEAISLLAVDVAVHDMTMTTILLLLTPITHLVQMKMIMSTLPLLTAVATMNGVSDVGPIQTTILDFSGHW